MTTRISRNDHSFFIETVQDIDFIFGNWFIITGFLTVWLLEAQRRLAAS